MTNQKHPEENTGNKDLDSWLEITKDIKKLPEKKTVPAKKVKIKEINPDSQNLFTTVNSKNLKDLELDNTDNIDFRTADKFKKQKFRVEAVLDLHGFTEKEAYEKVINFIKTSYSRELRAVIIVTGKGLHRSDEDIFGSKAVLKNIVPEWLNLPEIRPFILSYMHPSPKLGGTGALYILLRRKRT